MHTNNTPSSTETPANDFPVVSRWLDMFDDMFKVGTARPNS